MITPLAGPDRLDRAGLERLLEHVLGGGVHGLFILGTSGEGPSLSYRLRRELITATCQIVAGRIPVLVGITDTSMSEAIALGRHAAECGTTALVSSTPYYLVPTQNELVQYTRELVQALPLPLYLYNMPMLTKAQFEPETVRQLCDLERIIGLKDSSGDLEYFRQIVGVAKARPDWRLFIGPEHLLVESLRLGGHGGVNGGAQIDPKLFVALFQAARAGDKNRMTVLQERLGRLGRIYLGAKYASTVIKGMKTALSLLHICESAPAAPLAPLSSVECQEIQAVLIELGLLSSPQPAPVLK